MENSAAYLVTLGCSPNVPDKESGLTPLHLAVISGNPRIVRKLLIKGANKNLRVRIKYSLGSLFFNRIKKENCQLTWLLRMNMTILLSFW